MMNGGNPNNNSTNPNGDGDSYRALVAQCESSLQQQHQQLERFTLLTQHSQRQQQQQQRNRQAANEAQQEEQEPPMAITFPYQQTPSYRFPSVTGTVPQHQLPLFTPQRQESFIQQPQRFVRRRRFNEREEFFIFVKILFRFLEKHAADDDDDAGTSNSNRLRQRAKAVVSECTRRNRMGETDYIPLTEAVERRLRPTVGEHYWTLAKDQLDLFMQQRGIREPHSTDSPTTFAVSAV